MAEDRKSVDNESAKKVETTVEISEEDRQLIETLGMLVSRLQESDATLYDSALEALRSQIRSSTSSMTAVPKALKFLRVHYEPLVELYSQNEKKWTALTDILSVLAMAYGKEGQRETLKYRLLGKHESVGYWGHEYVRHLAMELKDEYASVDQPSTQLFGLAKEISEYFLDHNAEPDACDLLMAVEQFETLAELSCANGRDAHRVCLYLLSCVPFESVPDDQLVLSTVYDIYCSTKASARALIVALRMNDQSKITKVFDSAKDNQPLRKQLAHMMARQRIFVEVPDEDALQDIFNNTRLTDTFRELAKELDIEAPKTPEDIYKSHLTDGGILRLSKLDTPRANLAAVLVSSLVNAGYSSDTLLTSKEALEEGKSWIHKTKDAGSLAATAALGLIHLWNVDSGLTQLDRYMAPDNNDNVKAGALLGIGISHAGVRNETDPAWALLREHLESSEEMSRVCAIIGLTLAYGGSARSDIAECLIPLMADEKVTVSAIAVLALGHIFVGTGDGDIASGILQTMMECDNGRLASPFSRFYGLGLALLFYGRQEASEPTIETLKVIEHNLAKDAAVLVNALSYAGTGNVLKVQELLKNFNDAAAATKARELSNSKESQVTEESWSLTYAVMGIALISMAEDIGQEMSLRLFSHLAHYGDAPTKRGVPLALALLHASNPAPGVIDTLSKFSHDHDKAVAVNAIIGLGLVGAGTNHAKLAQMLRQLAGYYQRDADCLFVVRLAQGLLHMGKGTMTVSPIHSHRSLLAPVSLAGLLSVLVAFTDAQHLILENHTYLIFYIVAAMYPRFLTILDEQGATLSIPVRVGQAVEVVGQAGKPKTLTGFQTHSTPVLLAYAERAELATEQYISLSPILEGYIVVKPNPDWHED